MSESTSTQATAWLPRLWAVFLLALLGVTYRLWLPNSPLPSVPMFRVPEPWSVVMEWVSVGSLAAALVGLSLGGSRRLWWIVAASLATTFLLDQHRLQPWAYQSMIYATLFASLPWPAARRWMMPLAISVYVYSGLGKLDFQFAHSVGQEMLDAASRPFGGLPETLGQEARAALALVLPAGECLTGLCLIPRRLRPIAGSLLIAMHAVLIGLLGPWGLDHSWGVLIWNSLLIVQAWFLFVCTTEGPSTSRPPASEFAEHRPANRWNVGGLLARGLIVIALVAPLFERAGYWDHWLSWALYAPHSSRVDVDIHRSAVEPLGESLRDALQYEEDGWQRLSLSQWSLQSLGVPIYPQARYQLGLAREIARRDQLGDAVRAKIRGPSDRWSGQRATRWALGQSELDRASDQYWLGR